MHNVGFTPLVRLQTRGKRSFRAHERTKRRKNGKGRFLCRRSRLAELCNMSPGCLAGAGARNPTSSDICFGNGCSAPSSALFCTMVHNGCSAQPAVTGRQLIVWIDRPLCNKSHTHNGLQTSSSSVPYFFLKLCSHARTRASQPVYPPTRHPPPMCTHEAQLRGRQLLQQPLALLVAECVAKHYGCAARLAAQHSKHPRRGLGAAAVGVQQLVQVQLGGGGEGAATRVWV
jgi:hypothetical protein